MTFEIRPLRSDDRGWGADTIRERWGSEIAVAHGEAHRSAELEGFVAIREGRPVGLLTYALEGDALEIVTIDAFEPRRGIGRALVDAVRGLGVRGCGSSRRTTTSRHSGSTWRSGSSSRRCTRGPSSAHAS